ncbi:hypothetical protein AMTRI_Chr02g216540 [Amborella trichopoda]
MATTKIAIIFSLLLHSLSLSSSYLLNSPSLSLPNNPSPQPSLSSTTPQTQIPTFSLRPALALALGLLSILSSMNFVAAFYARPCASSLRLGSVEPGPCKMGLVVRCVP